MKSRQIMTEVDLGRKSRSAASAGCSFQLEIHADLNVHSCATHACTLPERRMAIAKDERDAAAMLCMSFLRCRVHCDVFLWAFWGSILSHLSHGLHTSTSSASSLFRSSRRDDIVHSEQ